LRCSFHIVAIRRHIVSLLKGEQRRAIRHIEARELVRLSPKH
jgi:hypothetical protein